MLSGSRICSAFSHEKYSLSTTFKSSRNAGGSEAALKKVSVILGLQVLTVYIHLHYSTQATKVPIYNGTQKFATQDKPVSDTQH